MELSEFELVARIQRRTGAVLGVPLWARDEDWVAAWRGLKALLAEYEERFGGLAQRL